MVVKRLSHHIIKFWGEESARKFISSVKREWGWGETFQNRGALGCVCWSKWERERGREWRIYKNDLKNITFHWNGEKILSLLPLPPVTFVPLLLASSSCLGFPARPCSLGWSGSADHAALPGEVELALSLESRLYACGGWVRWLCEDHKARVPRAEFSS